MEVRNLRAHFHAKILSWMGVRVMSHNFQSPLNDWLSLFWLKLETTLIKRVKQVRRIEFNEYIDGKVLIGDEKKYFAQVCC